jgi:hypothetical protein
LKVAALSGVQYRRPAAPIARSADDREGGAPIMNEVRRRFGGGTSAA